MEKTTIYAHTTKELLYPEYINISDTSAGIEITVRGEREASGLGYDLPGHTSRIIVTYNELINMTKRCNEFLENRKV